MLTISKTIETTSGKIIGKDDGIVTTFLGIPFAQPPIGKLRWEAPEKYIPQESVIIADNFGNSPIQFSPTKTKLNESEDCLFLNIWKPSQKHSKIPVFVWIYGGGFVSGSSSFPAYNGRHLAEHGILFVSFNYRLSSLGFMVLKNEEKPGYFNCNYGLKDQLFALEWVKKNIEAFGGDSNNITVGGESVGAFSITALLASAKTKELFHKVILLSGTIETLKRFMPGAYGTPEQVFHNTERFVSKLNLTKTSFSNLQKIPVKDFVSHTPIDHFFPVNPEFSIVEDGELLPKDGIERCIRNNSFRKLPMMLGFTNDEGTVFTSQLKQMSRTKYIVWLKNRLGNSFAEKIYSFSPDKTFAERIKTIQLIFKFAGFIIPELRIADYNSTSQNTYMFSFNRVSDTRLSELYGAYHSSEIQYFMGNLSETQKNNLIDLNLSKQMMSYWIEFINDNIKPLTDWAVYSSKERSIKIFDKNISNISLNSDEKTQFFAKILNC